MFRVVDQAFKTQILEDTEYKQVMQDYQTSQMGDRPENRQIVTKNYEKMRAHFDCLEQLRNEYGNLNNAIHLRQLLK